MPHQASSIIAKLAHTARQANDINYNVKLYVESSAGPGTYAAVNLDISKHNTIQMIGKMENHTGKSKNIAIKRAKLN